jgi:uncharacterized protein (TIGR03089 family)
VYQLTSPERLFADLLAAQPSRPFVSFHDDATGEWAELSAKSAANWVAKTHFLLTDSLGLGVGDTAYVALPAHWVSVPILLGCWSAGLAVTDDAHGAAVAFVVPTTLEAAGGVPDVFAVNPVSVARGFGTEMPVDSEDYILAVRPQPDAWASVAFRAHPADAAVNDQSRTAVVTNGAARAAALGLTSGGRLLSTKPWATGADWVDAVVAPLTVGASIVLVGNSDPDRLDRHVAQELATAVLV